MSDEEEMPGAGPDRKFKMVMRLGDIPLGAAVTMINGQKVYHVSDKITVYYGETKEKMEILAKEGSRFLVQDNHRYGSIGAVNAYGVDKELLWIATEWELRDLLDGEEVSQ